tara:strand:- start:1584 stop:2846 length:1263 start_codon:yes stop_codon:yes gene_type:complete
MKDNKALKDYSLLKMFPLLILVFSPKIDIISIPNYWQGIRIDDFLILIYSIYYLYLNKYKIIPNIINNKITGYNWILFFPYLVFSMVLAQFLGIDTSWIIAIRYIEYIALIIILNQLDPPENKIVLFFKIYIVLNFVIVILQYFEILGGFTSKGPVNFDKDIISSVCFLTCDFGYIKNYVSPGGFLNNRAPGITAGPWELAINLSIAFFCIAIFEKNTKKLIFYVTLIIIMMLIGQSRGIIFGFLAGLLFLLDDFKKTLKLIAILFLFVTLIYIFDIFNFRQTANEKFFIDYFTLGKIVFGAFSGNLPLESSILGTGLESMYYRAVSWKDSISKVMQSNFLILFGSGAPLIYTESLIIRIITSFGIFGTLIVLFLSRNIPLFFMIFILVVGITIDMFVSFKIFLFTILFLSIYKKKLSKN